MVSSDEAAPAFVRLAAHPLRWRLLAELADSDYRVRELVDRVGQPQNLVSYHLRLLRDGGLVTVRRSSFDARDSYYHLDLERCAHALAAAGAALHPALLLGPSPTPATPSPAAVLPRRDRATVHSEAPERADRPRVLFACTGNSARSPIAEALLRHRTGGQVEVASAGSHPKARIHPAAATVLRERFDIDVDGHRPRHLDIMTGSRFDYVITLCDKVREVCAGFGDRPRLIHWSIPDPATAGAEQAGDHVFGRIAAELDTRIRYLLPILVHDPHQEVQP
jgi:protein-tyrosine-phosphatase/DNA-binding transcriptional ArsR family regulator